MYRPRKRLMNILRQCWQFHYFLPNTCFHSLPDSWGDTATQIGPMRHKDRSAGAILEKDFVTLSFGWQLVLTYLHTLNTDIMPRGVTIILWPWQNKQEDNEDDKMERPLLNSWNNARTTHIQIPTHLSYC